MDLSEIQLIFKKLKINNSKLQKNERKEIYGNYEFYDRELLYGAPVSRGEKIIIKTNTKL